MHLRRRPLYPPSFVQSAVVVLALAGVAFLIGDVPPADASNGAHANWMRSWENARRRSKQTGRPVLVNFTGSDWCSYCVKMQREIFETPTFRRWAARSVVLLEVDFPRRSKLPQTQQRHNEELRSRYGVRGFPTILFLDEGGRPLGRTGYAPGGAASWIAMAERAMAASRRGP